jgi:hypothetical protein
MMKDRKARRDNRLTVLALANMIAAIVDTLVEEGVGNSVAHGFLDRLETLNEQSVHGPALHILADMIDIVRATVPVND